MTEPAPTAAEVAAAWDEVHQHPDRTHRQSLIHPTGADPEDYALVGLAQAEVLAALAQGYATREVLDVLDFGCGDGRVLAMLPDSWEAYGCDTSQAAVTQAEARCPAAAVFAIEPGERLGAQYDLVYCLAVLIHLTVADGVLAVQQMAEAVRPGGLLVIDVPLADEARSGGSWISVTCWDRALLGITAEASGCQLAAVEAPWHVLRKL